LFWEGATIKTTSLQGRLNLGFQGVLSTFPQTPDSAKRLCAVAAMAPNGASDPMSRSRRLARDCERLPETLAGLH